MVGARTAEKRANVEIREIWEEKNDNQWFCPNQTNVTEFRFSLQGPSSPQNS